MNSDFRWCKWMRLIITSYDNKSHVIALRSRFTGKLRASLLLDETNHVMFRENEILKG